MIISLKFKTNGSIPIGYQMQIVSLIKEALKKDNEDYYKRIYEFGTDQKNKKTKDFSFGVYLGRFKYQQDSILTNEIEVNITSPNMEFLFKLINGVMQIKEFSYKGYKLELMGQYTKNSRQVIGNSILVKTVSPLVTKSKNGDSLNINDINYVSEFNYICNLILKNYRGCGLSKDLTLEPVNIKKVVVKTEIDIFTKNCNKKYFAHNAYRGVFKISGDRDDLQLLYELGIGNYRNQGFGMIDII